MSKEQNLDIKITIYSFIGSLFFEIVVPLIFKDEIHSQNIIGVVALTLLSSIFFMLLFRLPIISKVEETTDKADETLNNLATTVPTLNQTTENINSVVNTFSSN